MKHQIPEVVSGYVLDEGDSWGLFDIVVPQQCINYVHNPSMARGSYAGYTVGSGCTIKLTTEQQRRGLYSLKVTPTSSSCSVYYDLGNEEIINGGYRSHFSCDILAEGGILFNIYVKNAAGTLMSEKASFTTIGEWMRVSVSFTPSATTHDLHLYIERTITTATAPFYLDGFQFEIDTYGATTYCDGDQKGLITGANDYAWYGERCNSKSYRRHTSRSGGYRVNLKRIGFNLTGIIGLGMHPVEPVSLDLSSGGGIYQKSKPLQREFSLVGTIFGKDRYEVMRIKEKLVSLLSPKTVYPDQPILIYYCRKDERGFPISKEFVIECVYLEGLEGVSDNNTSEQLNIRFKLYNPYIKTPGNKGYVIKTKYVVEDVQGVVMRDTIQSPTDMTELYKWRRLGQKTTQTLPRIRPRIFIGANTNYIYTYHVFNDGTGDDNKWDGSSWTNFLNVGHYVEDGDIDSKEHFWITEKAGTYPRLIYDTGSTYTVCSTGALAGDYYRHLCIDRTKQNGEKKVYFVLEDASNDKNKIMVYDIDGKSTSSFTDYIGDASYVSRWLTQDKSTGYLYYSQYLSAATPRVKIYKIDTTGSVSEIADVITYAGSLTDWMIHIFVADDGKLYATGMYDGATGLKTQISYVKNGITTTLDYSAVAVYDGNTWSTVPIMEDMIQQETANIAALVNIGQLSNGEMVGSGAFVSPKYGVNRGLCVFGNNYIRNIGYYSPKFELYAYNQFYVSAIFEDRNKRMHIIFNGDTATHDDIAEGTENKLYVNGDAPTYPIVEMRGPLQLSYLYEGTISSGLNFNDLNIDPKEYALLITSQYGITFYSNWRDNLLSKISPNSNLGYRLNPKMNYPAPFGKITTYEIDPDNRLSGWDSIYIPPESTSEGLVYVRITVAGSNRTLYLYKDNYVTQIAHTATFTTTGTKALVADNNSGVVGSIVVDSLPTLQYDMTVYFGYIAILWEENYTSLYEKQINVFGGNTVESNVLNIFGEDTIV